MENSFLSLKMKNSIDMVVDGGNKDGSKDTVYMRHMGMQSSFSNKVSVLPQFRPYKIIQDEKFKRVLVDPLSSPGNPIATTDAWDANRKAFNAQYAHLVPESPKPLGETNQLTIFYGGAVRVFDNISPEKARAIMHMAQTVAGMNGTVPPSPGLSSPISVTSQPNGQSGSGSGSNENTIAAKPTVPVTTTPHSESPKTSAPKMATGVLCFSAVPQARNASLKRFLEKRKERLTNTTPYNVEKKMPESSPNPVSEDTNTSGITVSTSASKEQSWFSNVGKSRNVDTTLGL